MSILDRIKDVVSGPGSLLGRAAVATSGAHPLPLGQYVNPATDRYYTPMRPVQSIRNFSQALPLATFAQNGHPGTLPTIPTTPLPRYAIDPTNPLHSILRTFNNRGAQPFGAPQYEDAPMAAQALQSPGYSNQTALNGQLIQGSQRYQLPLYSNF